MITMSASLTLNVNGYECERSVMLHYEYKRACRGAREAGVQMEPDEPASLTLHSVLASYEKPAFIGAYASIELLPLLSPECIGTIESDLLQMEQGITS